MTDERLVETVMDALPDLPIPDPNYTQGFLKHLAAKEVLAALQAAGYAWYRPDECVPHTKINIETGAVTEYRLVPVGGDS